MKEYKCLDCGLHFFVADDENVEKCAGCESESIVIVSGGDV